MTDAQATIEVAWIELPDNSKARVVVGGAS